MDIILYIICGIIIFLAIFFFVKEIKKMIKGKCCENCKGCAVKDSCSAKPEKLTKE